jgi:hypothetical protein
MSLVTGLLTVIWIKPCINFIVGVMVNVLVSSAVDRSFERRSGQSKDYQMYCSDAKHAALGTKRKYLLTRKQDDVSEWCGMYIPYTEHKE